MIIHKKDFAPEHWVFIQDIISDAYIEKQLAKGMLNKTILPLDYVDGLKATVKNNGTHIFFPLNKKRISEVGGAFIIKGSEYDILPIMGFKY
ncbi:hypothetical protein GKZ90_0006065 [Flavobacterium sp. MC2016-06]|uniref:hypothetical protein n=1 Tax=Flavobacterium sp. MC2016-06 TaxID=2676308 RepID=UPI0012BB0F29|nr:hypothetical protein [Flavobacterium sp. MC2016-06]MBU3857703.1 hypothetical protein [Flavobacterium sp. MC2016-06]